MNLFFHNIFVSQPHKRMAYCVHLLNTSTYYVHKKGRLLVWSYYIITRIWCVYVFTYRYDGIILDFLAINLKCNVKNKKKYFTKLFFTPIHL